jgi:hypothetical protein
MTLLLFSTQAALLAQLGPWLSGLPGITLAVADTPDAFQQQLTLQPPHCVLADAASYLQYRLTHDAPACPVVWMTEQPVGNLLRLAIAHQVSMILPIQLPLNRLFWHSVLVGLSQNSLSMTEMLHTGGKQDSWIIYNSNGIPEGFHRLRQLLGHMAPNTLDDLGTVYLEAVTNAVYHACKTPEGHDLYPKGSFIEALPPEAWVHVTVWHDAEKAGLTVRDQGGSVNVNEALYWLDRNMRGAGQLDVHGRGFYLMWALTDGVALTVAPGVSSVLVAWQYHQPSPRRNKPLLFLNTQSTTVK